MILNTFPFSATSFFLLWTSRLNLQYNQNILDTKIKVWLVIAFQTSKIKLRICQNLKKADKINERLCMFTGHSITESIRCWSQPTLVSISEKLSKTTIFITVYFVTRSWQLHRQSQCCWAALFLLSHFIELFTKLFLNRSGYKFYYIVSQPFLEFSFGIRKHKVLHIQR